MMYALLYVEEDGDGEGTMGLMKWEAGQNGRIHSSGQSMQSHNTLTYFTQA